MIKVADGHHDWFGRVKIIDCICDFVLLCPQIGQVIILNHSLENTIFFPLLLLLFLLSIRNKTFSEGKTIKYTWTLYPAILILHS